MKHLTSTKTVAWGLFLTAAVIFAIVLSACSRGSVQAIPAGSGHSGISTTLERIAIFFTAVAGICIIAAGAAAWFLGLPGKLVGRIISGCILLIAICQALYWIASNTWVLWATLAGALGVWLFFHRRLLEPWLNRDLDGDKKVG